MQREGPSRRPRVAIISQGLGKIEPPRASGSISIWSYETARHLSKNCSLLLVEFGEQAFGTRMLEYDGILYAYLPDKINRILNRVHLRLTRVARRFRSALRRTLRPDYSSIFHNLGYMIQAGWRARLWRSDIVHLHNFSQFVPIVRLLHPTARIVLHMNCEWLSQHDPVMISRRIAKADAIVCCSEHIRRQLLEVFPTTRHKAHVVYNGTDVERFVPSDNVRDKGAQMQLRVLFVGRISPEKGVHVLVEAFARIARSFPTASLELVGSTGSLPPEFLVGLSRDPLIRSLERFYQADYLSELESRIPSDLKDRFVFHGSLTHEQLAQHHRKATIFVSPSFSDAFPLAVVEAMAAGLPVVASRVGGIPEAVVECETGLLVERDNVDELADALRRLLTDGDLREGMAAKGRARALELFSWQAISQQIARVYFGDDVNP